MNSADAGSGDRLPLIRHLLFDCQKHQSEACLARCFSDSLFFWLFLGYSVMMRQLHRWELALFYAISRQLPMRDAAPDFRTEPAGRSAELDTVSAGEDRSTPDEEPTRQRFRRLRLLSSGHRAAEPGRPNKRYRCLAETRKSRYRAP